MSRFNFRFLLSNPTQISEIDTIVTVLWLIKRVYFIDSRGIVIHGQNLSQLDRDSSQLDEDSCNQVFHG